MNDRNPESLSEISRHKDDDSLKSTYLQWREFVNDLKKQWKMLWLLRVDDKVRAEGIAREDYPMLFVDKGTVIIATRKYKFPDFVEILNQHNQMTDMEATVQVSPSSPGWGKFIRTVIKMQSRMSSRRQFEPLKKNRTENLQKKKGGRGWVHRF